MNRKDFIGKSLGAGLLPLAINGFSIKAFAESPLVAFLNKAGNEDRVLVLIQLTGGNDGLNTVIPLDQYTNLSNARSNILINENKVLKINGTLATGLHPALSEIKNLYNSGKVSIIQNVGYPNQDYSHFRSTDIWLSGSDANQYLNTGWAGRFLDTKFPNFPTGYPNATYPDPPAIQIGPMVTPAFQGTNLSLGMSITDPTSFYQFVSGTVDPTPNTPSGHELNFLRLVVQQTQQYSGSIKTAASKASNVSTLYPTAGTNNLADQLKIVAQLIAGGLKTRVYMVSIGSFDTHSSQVDATGGTETGLHASLLQKISQGVNAFQDDLEKLAIDHRVLGMTFSEFGRRIKSNGSLGTDHGAAAPLFVFGKNVIGGLYGANPMIPSNAGVNDNVAMTNDFRSVYTTLLKNWFEVSDADLNTIMLKTFNTIPFIKASANGINELYATQQEILSNYPNPASDQTTVKFSCNSEPTQLSLFDTNGKELMVLLNDTLGSGIHEINLNTQGFAEGIYYINIQNGNRKQTTKLIVSR